jgi:hypothetical protein
MINIIISGNLGFLPHMTIIPAMACLDDACWKYMLPSWIIPWLVTGTQEKHQQELEGEDQQSTSSSSLFRPRYLLDVAYAILVLYLSKPVVSNLFLLDGRRGQLMNAAFDPFSLVNTYGAFGSVGKQRYEPIVFISYDNITTEDDGRTNELEWIELEFPCKPGSVYRRPCFCEPYHCKFLQI